jgi:hypothetical protein
MTAYFWKNKKTRLWSWRPTKKSDDWKGGYSSRVKAKMARDDFLARTAPKPLCVIISEQISINESAGGD